MAEPSVDRWAAWRQHRRCDGPACDHPAHLLDALDAATARAERAAQRVASLEAEVVPNLCAFCTWEEPAPSTAGALQAHVAVCEFHPLRKVERERAEANARAERAEEENTRLREALEGVQFDLLHCSQASGSDACEHLRDAKRILRAATADVPRKDE